MSHNTLFHSRLLVKGPASTPYTACVHPILLHTLGDYLPQFSSPQGLEIAAESQDPQPDGIKHRGRRESRLF